MTGETAVFDTKSNLITLMGGVVLLIFLVLFGLGASSAWHYRGVISDEIPFDDPGWRLSFGTPRLRPYSCL